MIKSNLHIYSRKRSPAYIIFRLTVTIGHVCIKNWGLPVYSLSFIQETETEWVRSESGIGEWVGGCGSQDSLSEQALAGLVLGEGGPPGRW